MSYDTQESVDAELLALYKIHGSAKRVSEELNLKGYSERSVHRKLKAIDPNYRSIVAKELQQERTEQSDTRPIAAGTLEAPDRLRNTLSGTRFVFTTAQNNTYVHEGFFTSLIQFCELNDAQLIVSRCSYNKSAYQSVTKDNDELWYDPRLEEFFLDESVVVANGLLFCGELDILPTAENPFSGLMSYGMNSSAIVPHVKMRMNSLPRMKDAPPRFMYTTGAVTLRNYIQRKAGQKAEFHHVFGALYVEIDAEGDWFARQLIADADGSFYDLTAKYTPTGVESNYNVQAINWGDIHAECMDDKVMQGAFLDNRSMLNTLKPTYQFIHDLTDFRARNHHNIKDPYFLAKTYFRGTSSVEAGIIRSAQFLKQIERAGTKTVVVESNHDLALQKWLREADIRTDPVNARYFHILNAAIYTAIEHDIPRFSIFENAVRRVWDSKSVVFLREDDSFVICTDKDGSGGIECGMHGHLGPNGSRGAPNNLKNTGRKANIGHGHAAGIYDGLYSAGVSCDLDLGYNKGPSSWSQSHVITYNNGKRAIITMRGQKWRA